MRPRDGGCGGTSRSAPGGAGDAQLKVVSRPAIVEAGTATIPIRLAFAKPTRFPANTPVSVDIEAEQHTGVLLVPAAAHRARR